MYLFDPNSPWTSRTSPSLAAPTDAPATEPGPSSVEIAPLGRFMQGHGGVLFRNAPWMPVLVVLQYSMKRSQKREPA